MKAVVVELKNNRAAVLSDDGCVITVKNSNYEIGQVIQMNSPKLQLTKKLVTIAASAAAFIVLGIGTWAYASPYTYVSLDVNPSIEFTINRFDRVLSVKAVNDDGEEILEELSLKKLENKKIKEALVVSVTQISAAGFFTDSNENGIVIATSCESIKKADELAIALQETLEQKVTESGDLVEVEAFSVRTEYVDEAKELGVTPGKLNLVEKLQEAAPNPEDISIEEWIEKPVKDIMKATKVYKNTSGNTVETASELSEEQTEVTQTPDGTAEPKASMKNQKEDDKVNKQDEKNIKRTEKEAARAEKNAKKADKDAGKAERDAARAKDSEKVEKDAAKFDKNAEKVEKDAKGADKDAEKADQDVVKADKDVEKADKDAKKADQDAVKADKDAEKADKDAEKADKDAEKADKDVKKADKDAEKTEKDTVKSDNKDHRSGGQADNNISSGQKNKDSKYNSKKDSKSNQSSGKDNTDNNSNNNSNKDKDNTTSEQEKNPTVNRPNKDNNRSRKNKISGNKGQ